MAREYRLFINGSWRSTETVREIRNPAGGEVVARCHMGGPGDINTAIESAQGACAAMKAMSSHERAKALEKIRRGLKDQQENFLKVLVEEAGKPVTQAQAEIDRALITLRVAAEEAERREGQILPLDYSPATKGYFALLKRFPIGVIGAITPFNFPLNLVLHKLAPAIASGNPIVLKPASQTPGPAVLLAGIAATSGLPPGAFNVVPSPPEVAEAMVRDDRVQMITFTGSPEVGWRLKEKSGRKRVALELGGNAAAIVHNDCDLDAAVAKLVPAAYGYAGQSCISTQRIYIEESIYTDFRKKFLEASKKVQSGDPMDSSVTIGPMINEGEAKRIETWVQEARDHGAKILLGGKREGAYFEATVMENVRPEDRVSCHEVFAPLAVLFSYRNFEEAIERVNDSDFGLQAGVFTDSMERIMFAWENLDVGGVVVNDPPTFRMDPMPYGGVKASGMGREGLRYAMEEMTEPKLLVMHRSMFP